MLSVPEIIEAGQDLTKFDSDLDAVPRRPAVFMIRPHRGIPYLARTNDLHRRLARLLRERERTSRLLHLRGVVSRVEYWCTGSQLESNLVFYEVARSLFPEDYLRLLKLRMSPFVKIILSNAFPRSQVTTRLGGGRALYYGPFRTRTDAEEFEQQFLDLFQLRRCRENLSPSPSHPGCIYGEMNMCLRPCQEAVSLEEYQSEVNRAVEFLSTRGRSLLENIAFARDRLSEELNFEEAARQHKRIEKIQEVMARKNEIACEIERLHGVAVTRSVVPDSVELWFLVQGGWQPPVRFGISSVGGQTVSMDRRLREIVASLQPHKPRNSQRQEHIALLVRWYFSSWRDGEWISCDGLEVMPYRKLVRAISRVAKNGTSGSEGTGAC